MAHACHQNHGVLPTFSVCRVSVKVTVYVPQLSDLLIVQHVM
jgi:hypothetical protein